MRITKYIYFYPGLQGGIRSWSNSIVIKGEKTILIDPGSNISYHLDDLTQAMAQDDLDISKVDEIWLTHGHPDHAEAAGILSKEFKSKVRCHYLVGDVLSGSEVMRQFLIFINKELVKGKKIIKTPFFWRKIGLKLLVLTPWIALKVATFIMEKIWGKWLPAQNLEVFDEEETLKVSPEVRIIFLPGHTPEEIGFWIEEEKILIIGDLINTGFNRETIPAINNSRGNFGDALSSIKKINSLPVEILIPAHGFVLRGEEIIKAIFRKLIIRMELHREKVKEEVEKAPELKYDLDRLSRIVLNDLPRIISNAEKKQYLVTICENLGYYNNGNGKKGKNGNGKNNHQKSQ